MPNRVESAAGEGTGHCCRAGPRRAVQTLAVAMGGWELRLTFHVSHTALFDWRKDHHTQSFPCVQVSVPQASGDFHVNFLSLTAVAAKSVLVSACQHIRVLTLTL